MQVSSDTKNNVEGFVEQKTCVDEKTVYNIRPLIEIRVQKLMDTLNSVFNVTDNEDLPGQ